MRRFLLGIFIVVATLAVLLGAALVLADREPDALPLAETAAATETAATEEVTVPPAMEAPETLPPETIPVEKPNFDTVPLYYQTDYPHINFGNGTLATSGCSVTCLAMVASYLTEQEYTPIQMAYHFGNYGKTHIERLDYGIAQMQLPYRRVHDVQDVLRSVREGCVAIVMMDEESEFTTEQHFIVVTGCTEDGKFLVNDPYETTYLNADVHLKYAYENGFEDYYLMRGFSGAWIFDKRTMPEEPFLYDASVPEEKENRYHGYVLTEEDIYNLACFIYVEGRNESAEVQQAMAEVVLNRIISHDFPNTLHNVLHKTELYRAVPDMKYVKEPTLTQYIAVDTAMYGPYVLPEDICFYSQWEKGEDEWGKLGSYTFYRRR